MKKLSFIYVFLSFVLLSACENTIVDATIDYRIDPVSLQGMWITEATNDGMTLTDSVTVMILGDNANASFAGIQLDGRWQASEGFLYTTDAQFIYLSGTTTNQRSYEETLEVLYQNDSVLIYRTRSLQYDGESFTKERLVTMHKTSSDFSDSIVGTWETNEVVLPEGQQKFIFKTDGSYKSFCKQGTEWVLVYDNGTYLLYGDLLVVDYPNDGQYQSLCYRVSFDNNGNLMNFTKIFKDSVEEFSFVKSLE